MPSKVKILVLFLVISLLIIINLNSNNKPIVHFSYDNYLTEINNCKKLKEINNNYLYYFNRFFFVGDNSFIVKKIGDKFLYQFLVRGELKKDNKLEVLVNNSIKRFSISYYNEYGHKNNLVLYPNNLSNKLFVLNQNTANIYFEEIFLEISNKIEIEKFCILNNDINIGLIKRFKLLFFSYTKEIFALILFIFLISSLSKDTSLNFWKLIKSFNYSLKNTALFLNLSLIIFISIKFFNQINFQYICIIMGFLFFLMINKNLYFINERKILVYSILISFIISFSIAGPLAIIADAIIVTIIIMKLSNEFCRKK